MANGLLLVPEIPPEQRTPLVEALLAIICAYQDRVRQLEETVQQLRDEVAIRKGQKPRPTIAPSALEQPPPCPEGEKKQRPGSAKESKNAHLTITREQRIAFPDPPAGSVSKGYEEYIVQDLVLRPEVTRYLRGSTRSDDGRRCRDTFASLKKTCRKLGIRFWDYLRDRIRGLGQIVRLADLIRQRAAAAADKKAATVPT